MSRRNVKADRPRRGIGRFERRIVEAFNAHPEQAPELYIALLKVGRRNTRTPGVRAALNMIDRVYSDNERKFSHAAS